MRYKFYREHKYISFRLNELERLIAKTDFRQETDVATVKKEFETLIELLMAHAEYEDNSLHVLLERKNSAVYKHIQQDHDQLDQQIIVLRDLLDKASQARSEENKIETGYQFYLSFRKFNADNLLHLHEEETIILPELQRLYSDEELKKVEAATYAVMSAEDLTAMLRELFPHMNLSDWEAFLADIQATVPEKFITVWNSIKVELTPEQQDYFIKRLAIHS